MLSSVAALGIAFVSLVIAILTFMLGQDNKRVRVVAGVIFLSLAFIFFLIGLFPFFPTAKPGNGGITEPQSSGICRETGGASGISLAQTPSEPPNGCVLIVEWWIPPDSANCGIMITVQQPAIPEGAIGVWWYVYPQRPDSHKQEFLAKYPYCKVEDFR
jgi:hypothetical protein